MQRDFVLEECLSEEGKASEGVSIRAEGLKENGKEICIETRRKGITDQLLLYNKIMRGDSGVGLKEFKPDHMEQEGRERQMKIERVYGG